MIDFTTLQANPIPNSILELQKENSGLTNSNKLLKNVLIVVAISATIYFVYKIHVLDKENEIQKEPYGKHKS
jgi:hypothetical protein